MECSPEEYKQMKQMKQTRPHVHAALIKAWADGAIIQHLDDRWVDCFNNQPSWSSYIAFRVKPPTMRYRNFLWKPAQGNGSLTVCVCSETEHAREPRNNWMGFIRWVGDWQEVEV